MSHRELAAAAERRNRTRWVLAVTVLLVLTAQSGLGFTLIAPALMGIASKYQTTQVIWTITIVTLIGAVTTPVLGKLGDRFGKRRVLLFASAISCAGSAVAALAPDFAVLLVGRSLMGFSVATLPVSIALVRDVFPRGYRNMCIAVVTNGMGIVTFVGPFIAGLLIDSFGVESVFWFTAALSAVGAVGTLAIVPESPMKNCESIDLTGAAWLAVGLMLLMLGLSELKTGSLEDIRPAATIGAGTLLLAAWWVYGSRAKGAFIDTNVLMKRPILMVILTYSFVSAAITVAASYLPTILQTPPAITDATYGLGLTAVQMSLALAPGSVLIVASGVLVGISAKRTGFGIFTFVGPLFVASGGLVLAFLHSEPWQPSLGWALVGAGAMVWASTPSQLMEASSPSERGTTAGMMAAISSALSGVFTQMDELVLNANIVKVANGIPIYTNFGLTLAFAAVAALGVLALFTSLAIPRPARARDQKEGVLVSGQS